MGDTVDSEVQVRELAELLRPFDGKMIGLHTFGEHTYDQENFYDFVFEDMEIELENAWRGQRTPRLCVREEGWAYQYPLNGRDVRVERIVDEQGNIIFDNPNKEFGTKDTVSGQRLVDW